jgi:mRNA-degrading endonuclease YafQ of YafQ-DinJ toxin-antitoxin module
VSYQYRAVEKFWRDFYRLNPSQKESVRRAWQTFKSDPFHPSLGTHEIHELSAKARHTIYSVVIEGDLRVIFRIDGPWVTTLDVGTHKLYRT